MRKTIFESSNINRDCSKSAMNVKSYAKQSYLLEAHEEGKNEAATARC